VSRPGPVAERWQWQLRGACRSTGPALFFSLDGERGLARARREAAAVAICRGCAVRAACRAYALAADEPYGVWGGLTEGARAHVGGRARNTTRAG
jgi:WhiB family transcriptional regulator, redox-sensing transcriptional regulator